MPESVVWPHKPMFFRMYVIAPLQRLWACFSARKSMRLQGRARWLRMVWLALLVALSVGFASLLASCSHAEGASLISRLDEIDAFIASGNIHDALALLDKVAGQAVNPYTRIGVYKRYVLLGESAKAEQVLRKAKKKYPANAEITALYVHFLLRHDRIPQALSISRPLAGGSYGSLYAEALLRCVLESPDALDAAFSAKKIRLAPKNKRAAVPASSIEDLFYDERFIPVYKDAWNGSHNPLWLKNAALIMLRSGRYEEAASLAPPSVENANDALFWALVMFDGGHYAEELTLLHELDFSALEPIVALRIQAIIADCCVLLGEDDQAHDIRLKMMQIAEQFKDTIREYAFNQYAYADVDSVVLEVLPLVYINSARYARRVQDDRQEYNLLFELVELFPHYIPGLAAYKNFALKTMNRPPEDPLFAALRSAGLKTAEMERLDALPYVAVHDARERIDWALRTDKNPQLIVLRESLTDAVDTALDKEKRGRVWKLLEENELGSNMYPPDIMAYALERLIAYGSAQEASELFARYLNARYSSAETPFAISEEPDKSQLWECEYAAYFAVLAGRYEEGYRLYDFVSHSADTKKLHSTAVINALVNRAVIDTSWGDDIVALAGLNQAEARTADPVRKAEILYRMAKISYAQNDTRSAIRSLQYALKLNADHHKARLLLKKIRGNSDLI